MAGIFGVSVSTLIAGGVLIGAVVSVPALALILGSPAYRKTIPITILIIMIGKRLEIEKKIKEEE